MGIEMNKRENRRVQIFHRITEMFHKTACVTARAALLNKRDRLFRDQMNRVYNRI